MQQNRQNSLSNDSTLGYSPLLDRANDEEAMNERVQDERSTCRDRYGGRNRMVLFGFSCCFLVFTLVSAVLGYFVNNGAFHHLTRDVRIVNGSVVEPNTGIAVPVNRMQMIDGTARPQRLIGVFLKTKHVPEIEATLHLFVLACYVDRQEGRMELGKYRSGVPHPHQNDEEFKRFVDVVGSGKVTFTGEYRMVMSPPGTLMHDHWLADLVTIWRSFGLPDERVQALKGCFSDWFLHKGFHNKDDIFLEYNARTKQTRAVMNGEQLVHPQTCSDPMFGRAFIMHEFRENGNLPGDLLPTLWNTEYDDDDEEGKNYKED